QVLIDQRLPVAPLLSCHGLTAPILGHFTLESAVGEFLYCLRRKQILARDVIEQMAFVLQKMQLTVRKDLQQVAGTLRRRACAPHPEGAHIAQNRVNPRDLQLPLGVEPLVKLLADKLLTFAAAEKLLERFMPSI